ncbi:MAG: hypothetical protein E4H23_11775 [Chrysiogenales bacterium]|nr:MAG: hypothetical protein E4H23_11775 [Chrysiogenales bacterium]
MDMLVEALVAIKKRPGLAGVRLRATGGATRADEKFIAGLRGRLRSLGMLDDVEFISYEGGAGKIAIADPGD